jgi:hypothetical protein
MQKQGARIRSYASPAVYSGFGLVGLVLVELNYREVGSVFIRSEPVDPCTIQFHSSLLYCGKTESP